VLIGIDGLADLLGERHRIIANDWQAAHMNTLTSRLLDRAADILEQIDFTHKALRDDLVGQKISPGRLYSAAELKSHAADLCSDSAGAGPRQRAPLAHLPAASHRSRRCQPKRHPQRRLTRRTLKTQPRIWRPSSGGRRRGHMCLQAGPAGSSSRLALSRLRFRRPNRTEKLPGACG
jgi:hypothetical protein